MSSFKSLTLYDKLTRYPGGQRHYSLEGKQIPEVTEFQVQFHFMLSTCNSSVLFVAVGIILIIIFGVCIVWAFDTETACWSLMEAKGDIPVGIVVS